MNALAWSRHWKLLGLMVYESFPLEILRTMARTLEELDMWVARHEMACENNTGRFIRIEGGLASMRSQLAGPGRDAAVVQDIAISVKQLVGAFAEADKRSAVHVVAVESAVKTLTDKTANVEARIVPLETESHWGTPTSQWVGRVQDGRIVLSKAQIVGGGGGIVGLILLLQQIAQGFGWIGG